MAPAFQVSPFWIFNELLKLLKLLATGTPFELDPVRAAFNIGTQIRWLDFNDTWLAAEW